MPEDLDMQDAESAAEAADAIGQAAPPATEPLEPEKLNTLAAMVRSTMDKLVPPGHMADVQIAEVTEPQESIPSDLFAPVAAMAAFMQSSGLGEFDPTELVTSNDGIQELAARVAEIGNDPAVVKAAKSPPPEEAPEAAEETEEPEAPDLDRFV